MGGIVGGKRNKEIKQSQNNLHYIVSYYFTQEKIPKRVKNPFIMCQQVQEDKRIKNFPLTSFKFDRNNLKYMKYEYRQFKIIQMIMLSPGIFVSLTEDGIQVWYENNNGVQKITVQSLDKIKNSNNIDITNYELTKFNNDLFFLSYFIKQRQKNSYLYNNYKNDNELKGQQFVLYSVSKIIKEGKIMELFSLNRIDFAFPISPSQVFTLNKEEIRVLDFRDKKLFKIDKNLDILKYPINNSSYLIQDLVLISSKTKKLTIIYSTNRLNTIYTLNDYIEISFNLGDKIVILIGEKIKQILFIPEMQVLSLDQYETDIFGSFHTKSFYPINKNTFFYINHKNRKLKEVFLNEYNELIIKKEITCPINMLKFCPFTYAGEAKEDGVSNTGDSLFYCALFICKEQTYYLKDENMSELFISENEPSFYSSTKRLFLSFFENKYIETTKPIEGIMDSNKDKIICKEKYDFYLPFMVFSNTGESTLNFASMNNKNLNELDCLCNIIDLNIKIEMITNNNNREIYIISIIKNEIIYIVKINDCINKDKKENFNFGNAKNIGILNMDDYSAFIYFDKKAIIINVEESFENKVNPIDTFLFPFDILYAYKCPKEIILVTKTKMFIFDYTSKKIEKEMNIVISLKEKDIFNISQVQNEIYIFINGLNYFLFDIYTFEIITDIEKYNYKNNTFLFYNKFPDKFEIIKKNLVNNVNIQIFREEIYENKLKMKYLSNGRIFIGCYPNKFFIFENNN